MIVKDLCFSVERGELFSLLGLKRSGKTSTIQMLSCYTAPTGGDAFINDKSIITDATYVRGIISVSPQENAFSGRLSVKENLQLICDIYKIPKENRHARIEEIAELLGLTSAMKKKAGRLTLSLQRRLSIAMALITEPEVLFLDEPTIGLDVIARSEIWNIIRSLKGKLTIIMATSFMEEAETLSDRVAIMNEGKIISCDTVDNIKREADSSNFEEAFIRLVKGEVK